jgi:hypothetical protein
MKYPWRLSEKWCGYWSGHHWVIHTNIAAVCALLALDVRAKIPGQRWLRMMGPRANCEKIESFSTLAAPGISFLYHPGHTGGDGRPGTIQPVEIVATLSIPPRTDDYFSEVLQVEPLPCLLVFASHL